MKKSMLMHLFLLFAAHFISAEVTLYNSSDYKVKLFVKYKYPKETPKAQLKKWEKEDTLTLKANEIKKLPYLKNKGFLLTNVKVVNTTDVTSGAAVEEIVDGEKYKVVDVGRKTIVFAPTSDADENVIEVKNTTKQDITFYLGYQYPRGILEAQEVNLDDGKNKQKIDAENTEENAKFKVQAANLTLLKAGQKNVFKRKRHVRWKVKNKDKEKKVALKTLSFIGDYKGKDGKEILTGEKVEVGNKNISIVIKKTMEFEQKATKEGSSEKAGESSSEDSSESDEGMGSKGDKPVEEDMPGE